MTLRVAFVFLALTATSAFAERSSFAFRDRVLLSISSADTTVEPPLGDAADALRNYAIALATADTTAARRALTHEEIPAHLRHWLRARLEADVAAAHEGMRRAYDEWPRKSKTEPLAVLRQFDRERVEFAVRAVEWKHAAKILSHPVCDHAGDARWRALRAVVDLGKNSKRKAKELAAIASEFDSAWADADWNERMHWAFGWRARAHLASKEGQGHEMTGARAWLEYVESIRWPSPLRRAVTTYDADPSLARALHGDGARLRAVRWLTRILRREEALALAADGFAKAAPRERAACFVAMAEQLYRLRRHEELRIHLEGPWPAALTDDERAELTAYPWGVKRRGGSDVEIARGFDEVVSRFRGSPRAGEAIWESAWMWELSDELPTAEQRYLQYTQDYARGPYARSAATRAVFLPFRRGEPGDAWSNFTRLRGRFGDGMDEASASWIAARALARLGRAEESDSLLSQLRREHPDNPYQQPPPHPLPAIRREPGQVDSMMVRLYAEQEAAMGIVAKEVGFSRNPEELPPQLIGAQRLLELGLYEEGDATLAVFAAARRKDALAHAQALLVAWRMGRPERQARLGFQLRLLLSGREEALDTALDVLAHPTPYAEAVLTAAIDLDLPAGLLWALMRRESFYDAEVVSLAGAHGLMQLLPSTAARMAEKLGDRAPMPSELLTPRTNLRYGSAYLRQLLDESEGDVYRALAAYNAGEQNGLRWAKRRDPEAPPQEMVVLISYSETRAYVYHVLRFWNLYQRAHPSLRLGGVG